jgi:Ni/Co efflux regulator RcnB
MNTKKQRFVVRFGMLALVAFLALPMAAFAQNNGRGRGKPTDIFVNGHDARDGRWDKDGPRDRGRDRDRYNDELRRRRAIEEAQRRGGRDWGGYGSYGGSYQLRQTALNAGYNNGIQEGRKDRQRGERFEFRDEGDYSSATEDYNSRFGNRELYRRYFREGFANGYRDGYNRY